MKRYLTLKKRVKAKDRAYNSSIQTNYSKANIERALAKIQLKLL